MDRIFATFVMAASIVFLGTAIIRQFRSGVAEWNLGPGLRAVRDEAPSSFWTIVGIEVATVAFMAFLVWHSLASGANG